MIAGQRYPIRIGRRSALLLRLAFGVTPDRAWAMVTDDEVVARFGWFELRVPTERITFWRIEGPWRWITAIGVRSSPWRRDLSFAGSPRGGIRLDLHPAVNWKIFGVRTFYVGVDDLEGFAEELASKGIPGEYGRRSQG